jgi:hypothetical protein
LFDEQGRADVKRLYNRRRPPRRRGHDRAAATGAATGTVL